MDKELAEARELQQWLKFAEGWIGEEFLEEEIHHLREAKQLIEDRISNLSSWLDSIQWRRRRLAELNQYLSDNSPI